MSPLALVTDDTAHAPEPTQLLLRPVIRFVEVAIKAPLCVRVACRRRPAARAHRAAHLSETFDLFNRVLRPRTFGECSKEPGPCPWLLCRHHLAVDVGPRGALKIAFPGKEVDELEETCSLRVAAQGELTEDRIAQLLGVTPERISQISMAAQRKYEAGIRKLRVFNDLVEGEWR